MELFTHTFNPNIEIYHYNLTEVDDRVLGKSHWFTKKLQVAEQYGREYSIDNGKKEFKVCVYKPTKPLKLIDINHGVFHLDFISKLNNIYGNLDNIGDQIYQKLRISSSLGLPSLELMREYGISNDSDYVDRDLHDDIKDNLQFMNNKSRSSGSIRDNMLFVDFLKEHYSMFDGYISLFNQPSEFHCGVFSAELCLFNSIENTEFIGSINYVITQNGGDYARIISSKNRYPNLKTRIIETELNIGYTNKN